MGSSSLRLSGVLSYVPHCILLNLQQHKIIAIAMSIRGRQMKKTNLTGRVAIAEGKSKQKSHPLTVMQK